MRGLYLLHFEPPYQHARHYLGWSTDIERRVQEHRRCGPRSSPLVAAAVNAGCRITLTRVWPNGTRSRERQLKRQHNLGNHCPACRPGRVFKPPGAIRPPWEKADASGAVLTASEQGAHRVRQASVPPRQSGQRGVLGEAILP